MDGKMQLYSRGLWWWVWFVKSFQRYHQVKVTLFILLTKAAERLFKRLKEKRFVWKKKKDQVFQVKDVHCEFKVGGFFHRFLHSKECDWYLKMKLRQRAWWKATIDFTHSEQALLTCVGALKKNKRKRTYAHFHVNICLIIQAYCPRFDNATSNTSLG